MWSTTTRQAAGVIPGRTGHKGPAKIRQGRRAYAERHGDSPHDKFHTGYGDAIPKGPVSGGIRRPRQIGPAVGEPLEAFTFCRREPSDEFGKFRGTFVGNCLCGGPVRRLMDEVC